jgi:hypothetical protein
MSELCIRHSAMLETSSTYLPAVLSPAFIDPSAERTSQAVHCTTIRARTRGLGNQGSTVGQTSSHTCQDA